MIKLIEYSKVEFLACLLAVFLLAGCDERIEPQPTSKTVAQVATSTLRSTHTVNSTKTPTSTISPNGGQIEATNTHVEVVIASPSLSPTETATLQPTLEPSLTSTPSPEPNPTSDLRSEAVWSEGFMLTASFATGMFEWSPVADEAIFLDCLDALDSGTSVTLTTSPDFQESLIPIELSDSIGCSDTSWRPNGEHFLFTTGEFASDGDLWLAHKSDGLIERLIESIRLPSANWLNNDEVAVISYSGGGEYESRVINVETLESSNEEYFVPDAQTVQPNVPENEIRLSENFVLLENYTIRNLQTNRELGLFQSVPDDYDYDRIAISASERFLSVRECHKTTLFDCKTHIVEIRTP